MALRDATVYALAQAELPERAAGAAAVMTQLAGELERGGVLDNGRIDSTAYRTYLSFCEGLQMLPPKEAVEPVSKTSEGKSTVISDIRSRARGGRGA